MVQEKRHIAKTISYRILSSGIGFIVLYLATGSITIGATFSTGELLFKPFVYYLHERFWWRYIKYGLKKEKNAKD
jgi:uncharacterized membrane protein